MPIETPQGLAAARLRVAAVAERRSDLVAEPMDRFRRRQLGELDVELGDLLDGIFHRIDPCDASPDVPLVLLPVRIETKLRPGTSTLRVRITPDEIHVDSLLRSLTDDEMSAGQVYWSSQWSDWESATAWPALVASTGARRAAWIARVTTPDNLADHGVGAPAFPDRPTEIAHGTVARCLPDHFIVRVFLPGGQTLTEAGGPVARDVPISPISLGDDELVDAANLKVPAGAEWTVSFTEAVKVGLGVEVELPAGTTAIERVVVVGARRSVTEEENAADLAELLASHRFTDGLSLLAPGTPTNNAEADRSPYQPAEPPGRPASLPGPASADAASLAILLGVAPDSIEALLESAAPRSTLGDAQRAANTALWFVTWDGALEYVHNDAMTPGSVESARRVHRDHVRAAGHAPTLRIGAQPYGVLTVSDLDSWKPRSGEITAKLAPLVARTLSRWVRRSATIAHIGPNDDVSDEALIEILGTSPVSTGVRLRPVVDGAVAVPFGGATGAKPEAVLAESKLGKALLAQYSVAVAMGVEPPSLHEESRTIALPWVSPRDAEVIAEILAEGHPKVDSALQALLIVAWDRAKVAGRQATPDTYVGPLLDFLELAPEVSDMVRLAVTPGTAAPESDRVFEAANQLRAVVHFDGQPTEQLSLASIEPIAEARTSLAQVALDLGDTAEARWVGQNALAGVLDAFAVRGEVAKAMRDLGAVPIDERRIAVASALDVASHRVDAWASAIAASRAPKAASAATIGAFGYVENIQLGPAAGGPEGWLQAPSSSQATTAGILASAHLTKIGAKAGTEPFAIELSSRRGAELRRVLEGIHAGQSIGALLGYQIERGLTGSAARFQLSLRELAPLNTDELNNDLAEADRTTKVAAADVVDGVALLRAYPIDGLDVAAPLLRATLAQQPDNAFITRWDPVSDAEWAVVANALRGAAATLDAVADALLSESVLQYVGGNASRASAAMDAMSTGGAVDPDLGVLGVRQAGRNLGHAMFAAIPEGATGWSTTRPRAIADPRLEAWAARRLGDPALIVVADAGGPIRTLAESDFAALDLVFADSVSALDRDLRTTIPDLADAPLAETRANGWPAGSISILEAATLAGTLRTMVAGCAPLAADGLVRSGVTPQRQVDVNDLLGRCDALLDALADVLSAGSAVISAIDPDSHAIAQSKVQAVSDAVAGLAAFGVPLVPDAKVPTNAGWAWGAWQAAAAREKHARDILAEVREPHVPPRTDVEFVDAATRVAEGILGDGFRLLPLLAPTGAADDFVEALSSPLFAQPATAAVNAFVRDHATVRPGVGRLAEAQLIGKALGNSTELTVVQLTERDGANAAPGTARWLAGPLPDDVPWPSYAATHLVVELTAAVQEYAGNFAGISFDGWTETLPFQPDPRAFDPRADATNPLRAHRATTGLAVQARQASARAPQVVISAVSADGSRWTTDSVVRVVLAAVDLAKARLVTLEKVPGDAAILPAAYVASPWLQPRKGLSFGDLSTVSWDQVKYPFLSEMK